MVDVIVICRGGDYDKFGIPVGSFLVCGCKQVKLPFAFTVLNNSYSNIRFKHLETSFSGNVNPIRFDILFLPRHKVFDNQELEMLFFYH